MYKYMGELICVNHVYSYYPKAGLVMGCDIHLVGVTTCLFSFDTNIMFQV